MEACACVMGYFVFLIPRFSFRREIDTCNWGWADMADIVVV